MFWALTELKKKIDLCNSESAKLAKQIVWSIEKVHSVQTIYHVAPSIWMAGGIAACIFKIQCPAGWKVLDKFSNLYYPVWSFPKNRKIIRKIGALEKVSRFEVGKLVGCTVEFLIGWSDNLILLGVQDKCEYMPTEDVKLIKPYEHHHYLQVLGNNTFIQHDANISKNDLRDNHTPEEWPGDQVQDVSDGQL